MKVDGFVDFMKVQLLGFQARIVTVNQWNEKQGQDKIIQRKKTQVHDIYFIDTIYS